MLMISGTSDAQIVKSKTPETIPGFLDPTFL
jgi:hypothetical protein